MSSWLNLTQEHQLARRNGVFPGNQTVTTNSGRSRHPDLVPAIPAYGVISRGLLAVDQSSHQSAIEIIYLQLDGLCGRQRIANHRKGMGRIGMAREKLKGTRVRVMT